MSFSLDRPNAESRADLMKEANRICENARVSIRTARHNAQKQIKSDEKRRVISRDEGVKEMKKVCVFPSSRLQSCELNLLNSFHLQMEEETKKQTTEVDQFFEKTKKRLEQG